MATHAPHTLTADATSNALAAALIVAPVVTTSSTTHTLRPLAKGAATKRGAASRCARVRPVWPAPSSRRNKRDHGTPAWAAR